MATKDRLDAELEELISLDHAMMELFWETEYSTELKKIRSQTQTCLKKLGKLQNIDKMLVGEQTILSMERELYCNSDKMKSSLDNALRQIEAAIALLTKVRDPAQYAQIAAESPVPENQPNALPYDQARQFFKAHITRLNNNDRAPLSNSNKDVLRDRLNNIKTAQQVYIAMQRETMEAIKQREDEYEMEL